MKITLSTTNLKELHEGNPMMMSYNVEFAEVTGGTFWKGYTEAQIAGTEPFVLDLSSGDFMEIQKGMMQVYPPVDLYNERIRKLAKAFGPAWIRVSGTWATKTYYDFDGTTNGVAPEGFDNVLTKEQWIGVLEFVKAVDGKLMVSVSNCDGIHSTDEPWTPIEAEKLFSFSKEYGVPILAAEFMNEPNMMATSGGPKGYDAPAYARDQDIFFAWVRANYPECLLVGPCGNSGTAEDNKEKAGGIASMFNLCTTEMLMDGTKEPLDVFSYHCYNGISERMAQMVPHMHWGADKAMSEAYLATPVDAARCTLPVVDTYCPGGEIWVTEAGDAGAGGCTWASTYLDVVRTLNELGGFAAVTKGVIFHNTLASSDYGFLKHGTFEPRPNYFAVLLWNTLMGTTVFDTGIPVVEGAHVYAHNHKSDADKKVYLVINNSWTDTTIVELEQDAELYVLSGNGNMRSTVMYLNDEPLVLGENDVLPELKGRTIRAGSVELKPGNCAFIVM